MIDKRGTISAVREGDGVVLELGCGARRRHPEAIGVDLLDLPCVDVVGDVFEVLDALPTSSVRAVFSYSFFEHVGDQERLLAVLARVLEPGGLLDVVVPHFSNPFYYSDSTHRAPFGLYSFSYFAHDRVFDRQVPKYGRHLAYELVSADLIFKSTPPRYGRHAIKKAAQLAFNSCAWMQELYEEVFPYLIPCYEVAYVLRRVSEPDRRHDGRGLVSS